MFELRDRILIIEDDPSVSAGLTALLEEDWDVRAAATGLEAIAAFGEFSPDVVLLDVNLPDTTGIALLQRIKRDSETTPAIMMSGAGTLELVVESMKLGAETFLQKPFDFDLLVAALEQAKRMIATHKELLALRRIESDRFERLSGVSSAIAHVNQLVPQIAAAPSPVLLEGEHGTGKGVLARLIHDHSPRAGKPFVGLNCAGLSKETLESELFGHERGTFANDTTSNPGLFEIAAAGTVFLDEVGEMEPAVQARLLEVLEEKRFRRVGGTRDIRAEFRLVAATSRDLAAEVAAGRFGGDLYDRLTVIRVPLPALRERLEDVPILVEEIVLSLAREMGRRVPNVSAPALQKLQSFSWPGNVRELRNVIERAMLVTSGDEIGGGDLLAGHSGVSIA